MKQQTWQFKRQKIQNELRAHRKESDRRIAGRLTANGVKTSHVTVGKVRKLMGIAKPDERIGQDGIARRLRWSNKARPIESYTPLNPPNDIAHYSDSLRRTVEGSDLPLVDKVRACAQPLLQFLAKLSRKEARGSDRILESIRDEIWRVCRELW